MKGPPLAGPLHSTSWSIGSWTHATLKTGSTTHVEFVESKGRAGDMRRQMILMLSDVKKLFGELKGLLLGEAKRLLGAHVQMTHIEPSDEVLAWIDERMERTMVQLTLSLELMPDFHGHRRTAGGGGEPRVT